MPSHPKPTVVKDPAYLKWVRTQRCWFSIDRDCMVADTLGAGPSECSHLDGKSRDDRVLPMCGGHHRTGKHAWHQGQRSFCEHFGPLKSELIAEAEAAYARWRGAAK